MSVLARHMLSVRLSLSRFGAANMLACLLALAGMAAWLAGIPQIRVRLDQQQQAIAVVRQSLEKASAPIAPPARSPAEEHLAEFYDNLGEKRYAEQQVKALFAFASKTRLTLSQAEYKLAFDKSGRYYTYQIILPVKGPYGAIRQLCEQILLAIPFASLDEIRLKRDAIGNQNVEATLRLTLYLNELSSSGSPVERDDRS